MLIDDRGTGDGRRGTGQERGYGVTRTRGPGIRGPGGAGVHRDVLGSQAKKDAGGVRIDEVLYF